MTQQEPRPLPHCVAIRHAGIEDCAIQQSSAAQQFGEFRRVRSVHRVDRVTVVRIAEGYRNEEEPACRHQAEAMTGQPIGLDHVLEEVAAEQGSWPKRAQAPDIGGISNRLTDIKCSRSPQIQTLQF